MGVGFQYRELLETRRQTLALRSLPHKRTVQKSSELMNLIQIQEIRIPSCENIPDDSLFTLKSSKTRIPYLCVHGHTLPNFIHLFYAQAVPFVKGKNEQNCFFYAFLLHTRKSRRLTPGECFMNGCPHIHVQFQKDPLKKFAWDDALGLPLPSMHSDG